MSDDQGWASPSGTPPQPGSGDGPPAAPGYAPPTGYGPPTAWGPVPPPGATTGWTPPPKPGLVPLRPLTLGTILGAVFQVMRRNPLPTFGLSLLLYGGGGLLSFGFTALLIWVFSSNQSGAYFGGDDTAALATAIVGAAAAGLAVLAISLLSTSIVQGITVLEVASGTLGERLRLAGLWRRLRPRVGRMVGWIALQTLAVTLAAGVLVGLIVALASAGTAGIAAAVILGIFGFFGLFVLCVWIGIKLIFTVPAIVIERRGIADGMRRSWSLTRGYFWRTFGIIALVTAIYSVAGQIVAVPVSLIGSIGSTLVTGGSGSVDSAIGASLLASGASVLVSFVIGAVGLVMMSATVGLLYVDTRMRKEGLDQDLIRAVEDRAAGRADADPYAPPAAAVPPGTAPGASPIIPGDRSPWA